MMSLCPEGVDMKHFSDQKWYSQTARDATKEFGDAVRTGFGQGGTAEDADADFTAVRGEYDTNKFVRQIQEELAALAERIDTFKKAVQ